MTTSDTRRAPKPCCGYARSSRQGAPTGTRGGRRVGGDASAVLFAAAPLLTAERIVRGLAERVAGTTLGVGQRLPTIAWGVADATGEATGDGLVEAAARARYRRK